MPLRAVRVLGMTALVVAAAACGTSEQPAACVLPDLVVGVQAEDPVAVRATSIAVWVNSESRNLTSWKGALAAGPLFPHEIAVPRPPNQDAYTASVHVEVSEPLATRAVDGASRTDVPTSVLVVKDVNAYVPCGAKRSLLRVNLQARCAANAPNGAVTCGPNQTCVDGACADASPAASPLEPYRSDWSSVADACAPGTGGTPTVLIGRGQTDYAPVQDGDEIALEAGPQGGHHLWIAVRTKDLAQRAATLSLSGSVEGETTLLPSQRTVFSLRVDEGGYCKLFGIRYQLDTEANVATFLGKTVRIRAELRDANGHVGSSERKLRIAPEVASL